MNTLRIAGKRRNSASQIEYYSSSNLARRQRAHRELEQDFRIAQPLVARDEFADGVPASTISRGLTSGRHGARGKMFQAVVAV
jgi:hypothetical protein